MKIEIIDLVPLETPEKSGMIMQGKSMQGEEPEENKSEEPIDYLRSTFSIEDSQQKKEVKPEDVLIEIDNLNSRLEGIQNSELDEMIKNKFIKDTNHEIFLNKRHLIRISDTFPEANFELNGN